MQKIILVTGTSTGLGASIAILAAKAGHKVYATMRDTNKSGALLQSANDAGVVLNILPLDVASTDSVNMCIEQIVANHGRIDVLINNAGSGFVRSTEQAREEDIAWIMNVNFMGVVRTTKAVIPHMRIARSGHIINISSVGGLVGQPFNEVYCASKFAVEGYTEAMASYIQPNFGVNFTAVEPGGIKSEFANAAMAHIQATGGMIQDEYLPILMNYVGGARARGDAAYQSADEVALVVMDCIESENPPIRVRTSAWANDLCELKTSVDPDGRKLQRKVIGMFLGG